MNEKEMPRYTILLSEGHRASVQFKSFEEAQKFFDGEDYMTPETKIKAENLIAMFKEPSPEEMKKLQEEIANQQAKKPQLAKMA